MGRGGRSENEFFSISSFNVEKVPGSFMKGRFANYTIPS